MFQCLCSEQLICGIPTHLVRHNFLVQPFLFLSILAIVPPHHHHLQPRNISEMEAFQFRLDSYAGTKLKRSKHTLKWPHPETYRATPLKLADAGFYFDPTSDDPDNVTCFMCGKSLAEWDAEDDPFDIHWSKCHEFCPWAVVRCSLPLDMDEQKKYAFLSIFLVEFG